MLERMRVYFMDFMDRTQKGHSGAGFCTLEIMNDQLVLAHLLTVNGLLELQSCKSFELKQISALPNLLSKIIKSENLEGVKCSWMLSPKHYQLVLTESLPVTPAEFQSAIRWKIKDSIEYPIEDAVIDKFDMPEFKVGTAINKMIMVVISRKSYLTPIVQMIKESGLRLSFIDIRELAFRNLTALAEADEKSSALIYIEEKGSELIITHKQTLFFSRNLEVNNRPFDSEKDNLDEIKQLLDKLTLEIQRSFDYFQSQWRQPLPVRIFLSSSRYSLEKVAAELSQRLSLSVHVYDIKKFIKVKPELSLETQGRYLPVIGGVLREYIEQHETTD